MSPWNLMTDLDNQQDTSSILRQALCIISNHQWIQTRVTVRKRPIRVKIGYFLSRVTLKFDGWHWKTIGHLSYATSSFVHHFVAICEFKLELRPESAVDTKLLPEPVVTYHPAVGFCDNLLGAASWELCKIIIRKMSLKLKVLESFPHSSGTNELRKSTCTSSRNLMFSSIDPTKVHYGGVIMSTIASQITSLTIVY